MSILLSLALQAGAVAPVDKDLQKLLQRTAKSVKPARYNDAELIGATVEGRTVVIHIVLNANANASAIRDKLTTSFGFEAGFCKQDTVRLMNTKGFGAKVRYERNATVLWEQDLNPEACNRYWDQLAQRNTDEVPTLTASPSVPFFEFRGITAGKSYNLGVFSTCNTESPDIKRCFMSDSRVAGVLMFPAFVMYKTRLSRLDARFDGDGYSTVRDALIAKYGKPSADKPSKWQNQMGAVFDNLETEWSFKSGVLRLTMRGNKLDESLLTYVDLYGLPDKKPVVDF